MYLCPAKTPIYGEILHRCVFFLIHYCQTVVIKQENCKGITNNHTIHASYL